MKEQFLKDLESNTITKSIEVETIEGNTYGVVDFTSSPLQVDGTKVKDGCINVYFFYIVKGEALATANVFVDMETKEVLDYDIIESNIPDEEKEEDYHYLTAKAY